MKVMPGSERTSDDSLHRMHVKSSDFEWLCCEVLILGSDGVPVSEGESCKGERSQLVLVRADREILHMLQSVSP